ncbi:leukocyte immunoglobulin-like receptor subfamily A member 2 [Numida meleagris]|uniref:leukocyte immunoglobulin-like receptor subfamily A member 2 n=1 Tax=Numida meleagris TaxID=8996 RepID=UPI000B3D819C|nr:leukocyte immunoglobulin-like receptor subfamily A member 2 [Numida meleagris]
MAPVALALILGWCLVAASRAQHLSRPSLSLHPSQGVSLGDSVTLRCHLPLPAARVCVYQHKYLRFLKNMHKEEDTAEFSLVEVRQEDAMKYQCQYRVLALPGTLEKSDPVELVVTDSSYSPPGISLSPEEHVEMGTNVTIQCWNQGLHGTIFLHKDGHSAPIQHQDHSAGSTATFTLFRVTPADSGTYRCSYRFGGSYFLSSPLADNVRLEVAPPGAERMPCGNLVVAVVRGCAAALVFGLGLYFILDASSFWIRRDESPAGEGA